MSLESRLQRLEHHAARRRAILDRFAATYPRIWERVLADDRIMEAAVDRAIATTTEVETLDAFEAMLELVDAEGSR